MTDRPLSADEVRRLDADELRAFVKDRDVPCPSCGYSLRGLRAAVCPECSQALVLRVGLVEPRLGVWVAALVGAAAGAGFNGLLLVYVVLALMSRGSPGRGLVGAFVVCNAVGLVVMGGAAGALVWGGRRFRRLAGSTQRLLAILTWLAAFADVAVFFVNIR